MLLLDTNITHHPRLQQCSPAACWFYMCCLIHTGRNQTDGLISTDSLPRISYNKRPQKAIAELVAAGLLVEGQGAHGYYVQELQPISAIYVPDGTSIQALQKA